MDQKVQLKYITMVLVKLKPPITGATVTGTLAATSVTGDGSGLTH